MKALVATPTVLAMMNDDLDWTEKLGDAVLAQQPDVMDAIQRLRARLKRTAIQTTKEQKVTVSKEAVRDELSAIQVSLAYVQAQNEYASLSPVSARMSMRFVSSPGKKDGLYWPTAEGEEPSPLGDLAAQASAEGYKVGQRRSPITAISIAS